MTHPDPAKASQAENTGPIDLRAKNLSLRKTILRMEHMLYLRDNALKNTWRVSVTPDQTREILRRFYGEDRNINPSVLFHLGEVIALVLNREPDKRLSDLKHVSDFPKCPTCDGKGCEACDLTGMPTSKFTGGSGKRVIRKTGGLS